MAADERTSTAVSSEHVDPQTPLLILSWLWVGVPLLWGIYSTLVKSMALFRS